MRWGDQLAVWAPGWFRWAVLVSRAVLYCGGDTPQPAALLWFVPAALRKGLVCTMNRFVGLMRSAQGLAGEGFATSLVPVLLRLMYHT